MATPNLDAHRELLARNRGLQDQLDPSCVTAKHLKMMGDALEGALTQLDGTAQKKAKAAEAKAKPKKGK